MSEISDNAFSCRGLLDVYGETTVSFAGVTREMGETEEAVDDGVRGAEFTESPRSLFPFVRSMGWSSFGWQKLLLLATLSCFLVCDGGAATAAFSAMLWLSLERRLKGSWFGKEGLAAFPK